MFPLPLTQTTSAVLAVTASSQQFVTTMISGVQYILRAEVDLWWRADSANPTAAIDTTNNHFLKAGQTAFVAGSGFKCAVIAQSALGDATLSVLTVAS